MILFWTIPSFAGGTGALLLAVLLLWRKRQGYVLGALTSVMFTITWIQFSNGFAYLNSEGTLWWRQIALLGELGLPITLGHFSLSLRKQLSGSVEGSRIWRWRAVLLLVSSMGILVMGFPDLIMRAIPENSEVVFTGVGGRLVWSCILLMLVLALSELEQILRVSPDPLRYQLKFILIGVGGVAGYAIAQSAQLLLLSIWKPEYAWAGGMATLICVGLITFGLGRWRMQDLSLKLYLSHQVLYTSFTFLIVGCYLVVIGILAEILKQTGWAWSNALKILVLFISVLGLVVVLFSRKVRAELQIFISRHFFRSKYDYRSKWLELTEAFSSCHSSDRILDQFLSILSRTFGAAQITIWTKFEADSRFHQVRSVNMTEPSDPLQQTHPIVMSLQKNGEPLQLTASDHEGNVDVLRFRQTTKAVACVPLQAFSGQLMGFVTLSQELQRGRYGNDDFDLLRAMAHHVTMLLIQVDLMEERTAAAEWEAVHRFSGFYLHDLKNLASSLSLVVQNAKVYGQDPEFLASAWRTIGNTVRRMMELMNKLSTQTTVSEEKLPQPFQRMNINDLVRETLESLNGTPCTPGFIAGKDLPLVPLLPEPFKQVILNVIVNARQAVNEQGIIEISTSRDGEWIVISVTDNGMGIPSSQLGSIFKPFRTSKRGGLGVGLYQCKQIIERHGGSIHVNSQEGQGTKILIALPIRDENS